MRDSSTQFIIVNNQNEPEIIVIDRTLFDSENMLMLLAEIREEPDQTVIDKLLEMLS